MPSAKYSCSGSPLIIANGNTTLRVDMTTAQDFGGLLKYYIFIDNTGPGSLSCVKNGTTTVTTADTEGLVAGMIVSGTGIPGSTTIASITNSTTFVLSAAPSAATTDILTCVLNNIKWSGGTGPTITATNNAVDVVSFITFDEGTTWYGNIEGQDIK